jgi:hypothetical protein
MGRCSTAASNDMMIGGSGSDTLKGMAGVDIVDCAGNHANFMIAAKGDGVFEVRDTVGSQAVDLVSSVEWLVFDD